MEVVAATPNGGGVSPFHNHDICEWSCVDSLTGVLERARWETDHWTANTNNSTHKYGKVVDCRARSGVDGNLQQEARRQLEVFQSQIPGGRLQVIKTHSVSSSKWTNTFSQESHDLKTFEDLHLKLNPLDVTPQKSKAIVGRTNVGRRPPSRQQHHHQQRNRNEPSTTTSKNHDHTSTTSLANVHRVSRLCNQIRDGATQSHIQSSFVRPERRQNGVSGSGIAIGDLETNHQLKRNEERLKPTTRTSDTSSEDSHLSQSHYSVVFNDKEQTTKSIEDLEDLEKLRDWRRTSKLRRSFQHPRQNRNINNTTTATKPIDLPANNGSVRKIREDIEKGRRLSTAFRGSNVNLEALDQILQSITAPCPDEYKLPDAEEDTAEAEDKTTKLKKSSFVTVESIKEARDRLRRTSSPIIDDRIHKNGMDPDNKQTNDDGIVEEISKIPPITSKVRSYIYGMENSLSKKSTIGTGSLESRSKHFNNTSVSKNEDWYNRRKSYGFEKMHNPHDDNIAKNKTADSSTDSGICRSSEITTHMSEESSKGINEHYLHDDDSTFNPNGYDSDKGKWISDIERTAIGIPMVSQNTWKLFGKEFASESNEELKRHSIAVDESKYVIKSTEPKFRRTSLAVNSSDMPHLSNDAEIFLQNRRPKKVEFCKTEVHFTAESGKVNIVETDEKPPPTNNFRRRRRNSGLILDSECGRSNGLPMFKFGDDISNDENNGDDFSNEDDTSQNSNAIGLVTVNSSNNGARHQEIDEDPKENNLEIDLPKSILKNKPAKPKRYILGDSENYLSNNLDNLQTSHNPWDVRLNPIKTEAPMWRSTVKVKSTAFGDQDKIAGGDFDVDDDFANSDADLTEFQKLLKNLKPISTRISENRTLENISDSFNGIRILSPSPHDTKASPWSNSVMDRIKRAEDQQQHLIENRGYSTKVNIGNGEATVIENNTNKRVNKHPTWPRKEETSHDLDRMQGVVDTKATRLLTTEGFEEQGAQEKRNRVGQIKSDTRGTNHPSSMATSHKAYFPSSPIESRTKFDITDKLSSPALVGKSTLQNQTLCDSSTVREEFVSKSKFSSEKCISKRNSLERPTNRASQNVTSQHKIRNRSPGKEVLRQPKKSEMAYFGVPVSPQAVKKQPKQNNLSERPDLLQFAGSNKDSSVDMEESIYENVKSVKKKQVTVPLARGKREFDSSILEELTRAADQILQAVNGYTDEDSENNKNLNLRKPLDTISETKSWKQQNSKEVSTRPSQVKSNSTKTKVKPTSSNSSIESVHKDGRRSSGHRLSASTSSVEAKKVTRKTANGDNDATTTTTATATRANVKARRLQRASSREALLQSHGSSSEDLPVVVEVPLRKPRLIRKAKNTNSTTTDNSLERKVKPPGSVTTKREDSSSKNKTDTRVPLAGLPEIRHKTAVSTIRSTAERAAARDKTEKSKTSESKRKPLQKRDPRGMPAAVTLRNDKNKSSTGRENNGQSQRAATANVKKCIRYDAS